MNQIPYWGFTNIRSHGDLCSPPTGHTLLVVSHWKVFNIAVLLAVSFCLRDQTRIKFPGMSPALAINTNQIRKRRQKENSRHLSSFILYKMLNLWVLSKKKKEEEKKNKDFNKTLLDFFLCLSNGFTVDHNRDIVVMEIYNRYFLSFDYILFSYCLFRATYYNSALYAHFFYSKISWLDA